VPKTKAVEEEFQTVNTPETAYSGITAFRPYELSTWDKASYRLEALKLAAGKEAITPNSVIKYAEAFYDFLVKVD
jgi:hypothetical protein